MSFQCVTSVSPTEAETVASAMTRDGKPPRFLRMPEVSRRIGYSPRQIYRMMDEGRFPRSHRRSHKVAGWYESEIHAWEFDQLVADLMA